MSNKELITLNPSKVLKSLSSQDNLSDEQIFWWLTNIAEFTESFKTNKDYPTWESQGYPLWELSAISREIIHNLLSDQQRCLIMSQQLVKQNKPNWDAEVDLLIQSAFGSNIDFANNPLIIKTIQIAKTNFYNGFYEKHESDFDDFLINKKLNKTIVDLWIATLKFNFTITALENEIWLLLEDIKNDDVLSSLWVDYQSYLQVDQKYGFITKEKEDTKQTIVLKDILIKNKNYYQDLLKNNKSWGTDLFYIANPEKEWELPENKLVERQYLYTRLIVDYLGKLDNSKDYVIKFK